MLYDQLDYFLDCDETLKSLVYAAHDPFAVMDQFVPPDSVAPKQQQQNKEEQQQASNTDNSNKNTTTHEVDSVTATTESCDAGSAKKKKGRRRGKKNKKKERLESVDEDGSGMVNMAAEEVVAGLMAGDPPFQNVQDELILLSSDISYQGTASCKSKASKGKKQAVIVPPDMLSECSDITDDESGCSDSLDLDAAHEDHSFFNAQRAAARRAKKFPEGGLSGTSMVFVSPSAEEASASGGVKIVEITDDVEVPVKKEETVSGGQAGSTADVTLVKSESNTKVDNGSGKIDLTAIKNEPQKKRVTAAERIFGDKAKNKSKKNRSKSSKTTATEEVEEAVANLVIDKETEPDSKAPSVDEQKSAGAGPLEQTHPKSEFQAYSFDDHSMQQAANSTPPRFMISPYNQQVNYSASNSRAQNNWLNHPMLNNFTNNPNPQGMAYQAPNHRQPRQQQHQYGQQRQQQEQQQYGSRQQQSVADSAKRTEPSVEQVMRLSNWGRFVQKVGYVVHILEHRNTRLGAGTLKPFADMNRNFALFSPKDSRIPRMKIPMSQCPPDLFPRRNEYAKRIYLAKITLWNDPKFALGELVRDIGRHGDILAESEAFLLEIGIDYSEFPAEVLQELPVVPDSGWTIPEEAFAGRLDLRDRCIFSVDPATARDLDDALSCESLPGNCYRVGVHIADVSYFFAAGSELDKFAASRATSVYLVDKVIPMLPRVLCEQLCSLNPDEDRLAFSVIWEMDRTGHIQSTWFGRTIIRSCAKLSYDHAQLIIDSPGKVDWEEHEMPPVSRFPLSQVCQTISNLQGLAVHMRARRHKNGALRLDQNKLAFTLDRETKLPNAVATSEHKQSNNLIEEYMLLANISVAHKIHESFPTKAVLRCHPEPQVGPLSDTVNMLRCLNIEIDISSSGSIYESILRLSGDSDFSPAQLEVVVNMLSKPMQNALYFCSGTYLEDFSHYALNVPFYTHFTSPIRRYPDVMVHRLLAAAIDHERYPLPDLDLDEVDRRLSVSNEKKTSAKRASEYSCELYLAEFVRQLREIHTSGIVLGVLDRSLDILLLDYCTIKRTYLEKLPLEALNYDNKSKNEPPSLHVVWSPDHTTQSPSIAQSFTYFTPVKVVLTPFTNDQLKFNVTLVRPES